GMAYGQFRDSRVARLADAGSPLRDGWRDPLGSVLHAGTAEVAQWAAYDRLPEPPPSLLETPARHLGPFANPSPPGSSGLRGTASEATDPHRVSPAVCT